MTFDIPITVDIPDGAYTATLESVIEDTGSFGQFRKWTFLVEHDGALDPLTALTSANTGPQSKSYGWLTAILGAPPKAGTRVESPNGKRCIVTVDHNEKGFARVSGVGPYVEPQQTLPGIPR